jgi:hypothetical protein
MTNIQPGRYRKKPVTIDAIQYVGAKSYISVCEFVGRALTIYGDQIIIPTLEGDMKASRGDWIIKGVNGEFYPCKPDVFEATYDPISAMEGGK